MYKQKVIRYEGAGKIICGCVQNSFALNEVLASTKCVFLVFMHISCGTNRSHLPEVAAHLPPSFIRPSLTLNSIQWQHWALPELLLVMFNFLFCPLHVVSYQVGSVCKSISWGYPMMLCCQFPSHEDQEDKSVYTYTTSVSFDHYATIRTIRISHTSGFLMMQWAWLINGRHRSQI